MIDTAQAMKATHAGHPQSTPDNTQPLTSHMVALIFEKPSTQTRVSFDINMRQMGRQTIILSNSEMQLRHSKTIANTAHMLSRYVNLIMIHTYEKTTLLKLAEHTNVPVINKLTNHTHPCQIITNMMTYEEHRGPITGHKIV